jgi:hypothetical protein
MSRQTEVGQCYVSPKLTLRRTAQRGYGLFAQEPIQQGELLLVIGGDIVNPEQLAELDHTFSIQIEEEFYIGLFCVSPEKVYSNNSSEMPTWIV